MTMRKMRLSRKEQLQQYRRMVFNVIARNQDDHTKNIAYLMNQQGECSLSPAFDMTYSYKPGEGWRQTQKSRMDLFRDSLISNHCRFKLFKIRHRHTCIRINVGRVGNYVTLALITDTIACYRFMKVNCCRNVSRIIQSDNIQV